MKPIIPFILFLATTCWAGDRSDITRKVSEADRDKDGQIDLRIETVYRGKSKVMQTISRRNQQGVMAVSTRAYVAHGVLVMAESDDDGDGVLETVGIFDANRKLTEMFRRRPDGGVEPVSTQELDSVHRQKAVADRTLRDVLAKPEMTSQEVRHLLEKNRQEIEAIKKEKKDGD